MCQKCIDGVALDDATHVVMSNNENKAVDMFTLEDGVEYKMEAFRMENEDDGDVNVTLCACEAGASGLVATIKANFDRLN